MCGVRRSKASGRRFCRGTQQDSRGPTLIVWGDRDALSPRRDQDALLTTISGSRLVVYEGAGHALHWEQPERFAADLVAFAKSLFIGAA